MRMNTKAVAAAIVGVGFGLGGVSSASAAPQSGVAAPAVVSQGVTASYDFNCSIPRIGSNQCGPVITLKPKQVLSVDLISSGGKSVTFIATDSDSGAQLATTDWLTPGSGTTKIFSAGNRAKSVRVLADASGWTTVTAKGRYNVG